MPEIINGSEAIVRGAIHAKCDFFAGYPITPATPILIHMLRELPKIGGIGIQGEDEIASIGMCIGAAMTGARVMTATSGPGVSLYSENIGLAIMGEVPIVIVNTQRMGPATGGATTVAQGDIQFMQWGTSGGYPMIVLAPTKVAECYTLTMRAFDLAERFRSPVFLAVDKEMVSAYATVKEEDLKAVPVREREHPDAGSKFIPYRFQSISEVPIIGKYGGPQILRFTTSSHDEQAYLSKKPEDLQKLNDHLVQKILNHQDEIDMVTSDIDPKADTLLISYGTTAQAMRSAVNTIRAQKGKVSALTIYSLWPVPEKEIIQALNGVKRVIVIELNHGQYLREIQRLAGDNHQVLNVQRVDGELIDPQEILAVLQ